MSETESTTESVETPKPTPKPTGSRPPWGSDDEFNPEKAWNLLQNVRADLTETKASLEAARKEATELQEFRVKAQEAEDAAAETALSLHRERAARAHNLGDDQLEFLAELTDPDAIKARAAKLEAMKREAEEAANAARVPARPVDMTQGSTASSAPALNSDGLENALKSKLGIA